MCQKESWGAIVATKEAHSTQSRNQSDIFKSLTHIEKFCILVESNNILVLVNTIISVQSVQCTSNLAGELHLVFEWHYRSLEITIMNNCLDCHMVWISVMLPLRVMYLLLLLLIPLCTPQICTVVTLSGWLTMWNSLPSYLHVPLARESEICIHILQESYHQVGLGVPLIRYVGDFL